MMLKPRFALLGTELETNEVSSTFGGAHVSGLKVCLKKNNQRNETPKIQMKDWISIFFPWTHFGLCVYEAAYSWASRFSPKITAPPTVII